MRRTQVRIGTSIAALALAALIAGCEDDDPTSPIQAEVDVVDFQFEPASITVAPSATVTWRWDGTTSEPHNVTFSAPGIQSSTDMTSGTFQATMPQQPGTYEYVCTIHEQFGMTGEVIVS